MHLRLLALLALGTAAAAPLPDLRWRELGPFRGGWATMVQGIPGRPDTFFFAAAGGGLWRTGNAGRTWAPLFQHGPAASVGAFAVAPSDPETIYLGTGQPEPRYDIAAGQGVFKSIDGGRTFAPIGLAGTRYIGKIWVDPKNPDTVIVAALGHVFGASPDRGIYRSTDGGRTWQHPLAIDDRTGTVDIAADPATPGTLYAAAWECRQYPWQSYFTPATGSGSAIYKSTDNGATWHRLGGEGWPKAPLGRISLTVAQTKAGSRIYATADGGHDKGAGGLYVSDDGGAHWRRVNAGAAFTGYYSSRITVAPDDPDTIYTVGQSIRRCTDQGAHCTIVKGAPGGDDYHDVWINPAQPDHMITGSDQGAVVTIDGGRTWSDWFNQPTAQLYHLAADNRFPYWIYAGQQDSGTVGIASRSDYGAPNFRDWHPVGGDERDCDIPDPQDPNIVYASGLGGRVTKWDARTGQVQAITPWPVSSYGKRPTEVKYHYLWVTPLVAGRAGPPSLYLGAQVLFRSRDRGATWQTISPDLTGKQPGAKDCGGVPTPAAARACGYGTIAAIEPSPRHGNEIWIGTDDGLIQKTVDGGGTWQDITPPNLPLWSKVVSLDVSAHADGTAYAVIDGQRLDDWSPHVLRTHDGGRTWQPIVHNLPDGHVAAVLRSDPAKDGLLYLGTDNAIFVSFNDGEDWIPLQQNLPTTWVRDLLVHDNDLIAATQGRGIWVLDGLSPLRQFDPAAPAQALRLFTPAAAVRVHPNNNADTPLPPETPVGENPPAGAIIDYVVGAGGGGPVSLDIKDADGHTVRRFTSNDKPAPVNAERYFAKGWLQAAGSLPATPGPHRFVWDLREGRPPAITFTYSIGAIWGQDTSALPLGPWAVPGRYTLVLKAGNETKTATLDILPDPRITAAPADLTDSHALSVRIGQALARNRAGFAEQDGVRKQLDRALDTLGKRLPDAVRAAADTLANPPPGSRGFDKIDEILAGIETDLEAADTAPTAAQRTVVDETITDLDSAAQRWKDFKAKRLPDVNAALLAAGQKPVTVPDPAAFTPDPPEAGQEVP